MNLHLPFRQKRNKTTSFLACMLPLLVTYIWVFSKSRYMYLQTRVGLNGCISSKYVGSVGNNIQLCMEDLNESNLAIKFISSEIYKVKQSCPACLLHFVSIYHIVFLISCKCQRESLPKKVLQSINCYYLKDKIQTFIWGFHVL